MFVTRLMERYSRYLDAKPFKSRCVTGALLCLTGDFITQVVFEKRSFFKAFTNKSEEVSEGSDTAFDFARSGRALFVGATVISFNLYGWYSKLLPMILRRFQGSYMLKNYQTLSITFMGKRYFYFGDFSELFLLSILFVNQSAFDVG